MRSLSPLALLINTVTAVFMAVAPTVAAASGSNIIVAAPEVFADLASERQLVLDVYFAGEKVGEARARARPGALRFDDPDAVSKLIPKIASPEGLAKSLSGDLPTNSDRVCGLVRPEGCGSVEPETSAIILNEDQFRVDVFVNRALVMAPEKPGVTYLDAPTGDFSLVSLFGGNISGSSAGNPSYHFQNRSIAAIGELRFRSDSSLADRSGLSFDNLTAEIEIRNWRYLGGAFYAPGTDLIGRRRIVGLGATTQFDTIDDKADLAATPLSVYLQQPGRVEMLIDGKIVSSRPYPAGHNVLDTASLPNGSYDVALRISEQGGFTRTERRFFTKGAAVAPLGHPIFSGVLGLLDNPGGGVIPSARAFLYQASAAFRPTAAVGLDLTLLGTEEKTVVQAGAALLTSKAQFRIAGLASSAADYGLMISGSTAERAGLALNFDLRKVQSRNGRAILPVTASSITFSNDPELRLADRGSFTQGLATVSQRVGPATLRLTGIYRRNASARPSYSVGAGLDLSLVRADGWSVWLQSDARKTDRDVATFVGLRFLTSRGFAAVSGTIGANTGEACRRGNACATGELQSGWSGAVTDQASLTADTAIGKDSEGRYARAGGSMRSTLFNAHADIIHRFGQNDGGTQYGASIDGGLVLSGDQAHVLGRDLNDSAVVISVKGNQRGEAFDVLVDEIGRGKVSPGKPLVLLLRPYSSYSIRLRPAGNGSSSFDTNSKKVTLYPGMVSRLAWSSTPLAIVFGRAKSLDGRAIADAALIGDYGVGETDHEGYFQIEASLGESLELRDRGGSICRIQAPSSSKGEPYVSAGDVTCR